jgi:hypothetical protein
VHLLPKVRHRPDDNFLRTNTTNVTVCYNSLHPYGASFKGNLVISYQKVRHRRLTTIFSAHAAQTQQMRLSATILFIPMGHHSRAILLSPTKGEASSADDNFLRTCCTNTTNAAVCYNSLHPYGASFKGNLVNFAAASRLPGL